MLGKSHLNPHNNYGELMNTALENFNKLIKEKHLSAFFVSKELGYSSSYFYNWKKGKSFPTLMALCNIAEYLDISLLELLGFGTDNVTETEKEILKRYNSLSAQRQIDAIAFLVSLQSAQQEEDYRLKQAQLKMMEKKEVDEE